MQRRDLRNITFPPPGQFEILPGKGGSLTNPQESGSHLHGCRSAGIRESGLCVAVSRAPCSSCKQVRPLLIFTTQNKKRSKVGLLGWLLSLIWLITETITLNEDASCCKCTHWVMSSVFCFYSYLSSKGLKDPRSCGVGGPRANCSKQMCGQIQICMSFSWSCRVHMSRSGLKLYFVWTVPLINCGEQSELIKWQVLLLSISFYFDYALKFVVLGHNIVPTHILQTGCRYVFAIHAYL